MSSYSVQVLTEKLARLSLSQDSIETLSLWIIHHKSKAKTSVSTWLEEFKKGDAERRLVLFYLANDVLQNGRRRGAAEFLELFQDTLRVAIPLTKGQKIQNNIVRVLRLWKERKIYDTQFLGELNLIVEPSKPKPPVEEKPREMKLSLLEDALTELGKFEAELKVKSSHLAHLRVDINNPTSSLEQLKDKSDGGRVSMEINDAAGKLQDYCECLGVEVNERINILDMLRVTKAFYTYKFNDFKKTMQNYKDLGTRLTTLHEKLQQHLKEKERAQSTATSDPTAEDDITVVGDMEIESDGEGSDEPLTSAASETVSVSAAPAVSASPPAPSQPAGVASVPVTRTPVPSSMLSTATQSAMLLAASHTGMLPASSAPAIPPVSSQPIPYFVRPPPFTPPPSRPNYPPPRFPPSAAPPPRMPPPPPSRPPPFARSLPPPRPGPPPLAPAAGPRLHTPPVSGPRMAVAQLAPGPRPPGPRMPGTPAQSRVTILPPQSSEPSLPHSIPPPQSSSSVAGPYLMSEPSQSHSNTLVSSSAPSSAQSGVAIPPPSTYTSVQQSHSRAAIPPPKPSEAPAPILPPLRTRKVLTLTQTAPRAMSAISVPSMSKSSQAIFQKAPILYKKDLTQEESKTASTISIANNFPLAKEEEREGENDGYSPSDTELYTNFTDDVSEHLSPGDSPQVNMDNPILQALYSSPQAEKPQPAPSPYRDKATIPPTHVHSTSTTPAPQPVTVETMVSKTMKTSSAGENGPASPDKTAINPSQIKITPALTSLLDELLPTLSKTLQGKKRKPDEADPPSWTDSDQTSSKQPWTNSDLPSSKQPRMDLELLGPGAVSSRPRQATPPWILDRTPPQYHGDFPPRLRPSYPPPRPPRPDRPDFHRFPPPRFGPKGSFRPRGPPRFAGGRPPRPNHYPPDNYRMPRPPVRNYSQGPANSYRPDWRASFH